MNLIESTLKGGLSRYAHRGEFVLNQATTAVLDDNQGVEQAERGSADEQEITGDDSLRI